MAEYDFPGYIPSQRRNPALDQWSAQGMMGPRTAPPPSVGQMAIPQGMNPYDLGIPVQSTIPQFQGSGGVSIPYPSDINPPQLIGGLESGMMTPAPQAPIDAGVPYNPGGPVASYDLPMQAPNMSQLFRGGGGGGQMGPLPPHSFRNSIPRNDFIYTNPAAAQQAAASLQARLGYEQAQNQGYRQAQISQQQAQTANANQQANQQQRILEAEKDRQLQREGFASSERSAASRIGGSEFDKREAARQDELKKNQIVMDRERFRQASSLAAYLNNPNIPKPQKDKLIDPQAVHQNPNGVWVPSVNNPDAAPPTAASVTPIEQVLPRAGSAPPAPPTGVGPETSAPMFPGPAPVPPTPPPQPWYRRWFDPTAALQGVQ